MFNFTKAVSNILLEQDQQLPDWFNNILQKHDQLGFSRTKLLNNDTKLNEIWVKVAGKNYVAGSKDIGPFVNEIRIFDLLRLLYEQTADKTKTTTWPAFKAHMSDSSDKDYKNYQTTCETLYKQISGLNVNNRDNWPPAQSTKLRAAYDSYIENTANQAEKSLEEDAQLTNLSVIDAVQQIINRRIQVLVRVLSFKSPTKPFNTLIKDIFRTPELFKTGAKSYSKDFEGIDDLYIKDVINVAMAAKEFYADTIAELKLTQQEPQQQNVNTSLNLFDKFVGDILNEYDQTFSKKRLLRNLAANRAALQASNFKDTSIQEPQIDQQEKERIKQQLYTIALKDVQNRMNFLEGIPVQYKLVDIQTGKETNETRVIDSSKEYSVGNIIQLKKEGNIKAAALVDTLSQIATYERKSPGAGERMKHLGNFASSMMDMMGVQMNAGPGR
jgi:hypothetical protein